MNTQLRESIAVEYADAGLDPAVQDDAWRRQFLDRYRSLTAEEFSAAASSEARNVHALPSRWEKENKIFGLQVGRITRYPRFQLHHHQARPLMADLIALFRERFGRDYDGWDVAFFMGNPSAYLGGQRPADLLEQRGASERILGAARGHLQTAYDV